MIYFRMAFGVCSLWNAVYGATIAAAGDRLGLQVVFVLMAATFVAAAQAPAFRRGCAERVR